MKKRPRRKKVEFIAIGKIKIESFDPDLIKKARETFSGALRGWVNWHNNLKHDVQISYSFSPEKPEGRKRKK